MSSQQSAHDAVHQQSWELLPWHVNGTLDEAEKTLLDKHLMECLICRKELEILRDIASTMSESREQQFVPASSLAATMKRIRSAERRATSQGAWRRVTRRVLDSFDSLSLEFPFVARFVVAQTAVILVLVAIVLTPWLKPVVPLYRTLADTEDPAHGDRARIYVVFDKAITEGEIRSLLSGVRGRLAGGPSTAGVYLVEIPVGDDVGVGRKELLRQLRAHDGVQFAEVAAGG